MVKFSRILVPIDFSPAAEQAAERAEELAKATAAELVFVHVVDVTPILLADGAGYLPAETFAELEARAKHQLEVTTARAVERGSAARGLLMNGPPAATIVDLAEREGAAMIVMGTHGRSGVARWVLGSVAERVARSAKVPVLTVRGATPPAASETFA